MFIWTVKHPEHEAVKVEAEKRLDAVVTAARLWGVPWTSVGRECDAKIESEIKKEMPKLPAKKASAKKKGAHHGD